MLKLEKWANSSIGATLSRLAVLSILPLIGLLSWFGSNFVVELNARLELLESLERGTGLAIAALQVQMIERTGDRLTRTEAAAVNEAQNQRIEALEVDVDRLTERILQLGSASGAF